MKTGSRVLACLLLVAATACQTPRGPGDSWGSGPGSASTASVGAAIGHLQDGEVVPAERMLKSLAESRPDDPIVRLLLDQIRQPPEALLGDAFDEVQVRPGESLSLLAGRHAGDELLFFALARLNDIPRPRLLQPGQILRVPSGVVGQRASETAGGGSPAGAVSAPESSGRAGPTGGSVIAAPGERVAGTETALKEVRALLEAGDHEAAAQKFIGVRESAGEDLAGSGEGEGAALRDALGKHFHDRALSAWRDQRVETAIADWERVLRIDPAFRPAAVYLERALRVQRRLEMVEEQ